MMTHYSNAIKESEGFQETGPLLAQGFITLKRGHESRRGEDVDIAPPVLCGIFSFGFHATWADVLGATMGGDSLPDPTDPNGLGSLRQARRL